MGVRQSEAELERRVEARTAELTAALRASDARFRALLENSIDVTGILDADLRMQYVSPSVKRILGYTVDELVGETSPEFIHPDDAGILDELFARTEDDERVVTQQFRARHKDGSWRLMEAVGLNLLADPDVHGMVVTARDVTARRGLEERLRQSERLDAIGQLAGGVAHDFNNVLLVIRGYSSVLRATLDDPQQIADIDEIANAADRATQLTRQLLAFGRRQVLATDHQLRLGDEAQLTTVERHLGTDSRNGQDAHAYPSAA
jgi:PAS domain S-box-containing protein